MRTYTALFVLLEILLVNAAAVHSDSQCLINVTDRDYNSCEKGYFCYCNNGGVLKRTGRSNYIICDDNFKLKLTDFHAFLPEKQNELKCDLNPIRFKKKERTGCLPQAQRDAIALPFLSALKGMTAKDFKQSASAQQIRAPDFKYKLITLEVGCEIESKPKVDMCEARSTVIQGTANVSLYFNPVTFQNHGNQSGCYCYFETFNTSRGILVRALDISLHHLTQLFLGSNQLSSSHVYWWQSGVLSNRLTFLKLIGPNPQDYFEMVWMDVYGTNMNITCDTKPLDVKVLVTSTTQKYASSSSGGLGIAMIIGIVIGVVFVIVVLCSVGRCIRLRLTRASKSGEYDVDDPAASENFISSTYEKGDDPPSPRDSVVIYSKMDKKTAVKSQPRKGRKGGESDEYHLYELDSETELEDNTTDPGHHSEHKFSHDAIVHDQPHDMSNTPQADDGSNIYNHFHEHPDVVPTSTTSNIYDTAGRDVYSSLQTHRQISKPDNTYSVA